MNKNSINAAPFLARLGVVAAALLAGCGGGGSSSSSSPPPPAPTYLLGGTVTGLRDGDSLTVANGTDSVSVSANGSFNFPQRLVSGASYKVSLTKSPEYVCRLSNEAANVASADVTAVSVQCTPYVLAGKESTLRQPAGFAIDADGNAYVADFYYNAIQKITPAGVVSFFAGPKEGGGDYVDGPAGEARFRFNSDTAMIIDRDGSLIVSDTCNRSIRKVTKTGVVSTVAGPASRLCTLPQAPKDGVGSAASFDSIKTIALDVNGDYLVGGGQYAIRRVTPAGVVSTMRWTSPKVSVGSTETLDYVAMLTVDKNGTIYATNSRYRVWKIADGVATPVVGSAGMTYSAVDGVGKAAGFNWLHALTSDNAGNLYVSDNGMVRKISTTGNVSSLAGTYFPDPSIIPPPAPDQADGSGAAARFASADLLVVDTVGNIVVMDRRWLALRYITPQGVVTTHPGTPVVQQFRDGAGGSARFADASTVAPTVDAKGNIFVRDFSTIRMITPNGTVSRYVGIMGSDSVIDGNKDSATVGRFGPVIADNSGALYLVGGSAASLRKIVDGTVSTVFQNPEFSVVRAAAVSPAGNFAVAHRDSVKVYSKDGTLLDTIDRARIAAVIGYQSSGYFPGLAYDSSGNLFISDASGAVIYKFSKDGVLSTFAGKPGVFRSADGAPGTGTFGQQGLGQLTIDPSGNLYTYASTWPELLGLRKISPLGVISTLPTPWENPPSSGVAYGNGRLYAMSKNALMQMALP